MIPKSVQRFSEKILLHEQLSGDDDSKKSHHAPSLPPVFLANAKGSPSCFGTVPSVRHLTQMHRSCAQAQMNERRMTMPRKFAAGNLEGGPGASHENQKQPKKSKPHGELRTLRPKQGNTKRTAQGKSGKGKAPWR